MKLISEIKAAQEIRIRAQTKISESESAANAAEEIIFHLNNLNRNRAKTDARDGIADLTTCAEMITSLADVTLMLTEGHQKYNLTKGREVTEALTEVNAIDLKCSEQDVNSLNSTLNAAKDKARLIVQVETEIAGSVSEALNNLYPGQKTRTGGNKHVSMTAHHNNRHLPCFTCGWFGWHWGHV